VDVVDLVTVENTHQVGGGSVLPVADLAAIARVCAAQHTPLYLDGARIFNAAVVTGATVAQYAAQADAMMFCLSKGLGAPVGSVLAGDTEFIREAQRHFKSITIDQLVDLKIHGILAASDSVPVVADVQKVIREAERRISEAARLFEKEK